ncbi:MULTISPECIES: AraC family transcriptional regulator [unclassified Sporosarcina]|uniref:AraC family transcriptional regulator n=1 Tax=unclassified Sporosarcina TaxID=2647733 RepID=UPI00203E071A|nr:MULTISPECIES: AraC family transcriptional regulator [unclassified Sporosarcina]GKV65133.1 AraC family transcriptional regulator [Sporosarcina sp. NCCP-2331]GLB55257.1 AraC family transcriptional regulator [Sporosarcina sp. NCCP-2378]
MKRKTFKAYIDEDTRIEAYQLKGNVQPFPNHFHEHYTIGFIERGHCLVSCKNQEYTFSSGDIILLNPYDNHTFIPKGDETILYRGFIIHPEVMEELILKVTGQNHLPIFPKTLVRDEELSDCLRNLFHMIVNGFSEIEKEESLFFLATILIGKYSQSFEKCLLKCQEEVERACDFINRHYTENITLEQICQYAALSKSTLLRVFTKAKGITPYRYMITIRISKAKKMLEQGVLPVDAAFKTGFSDQSHFTNYFTTFIGISPGAYRNLVIS